MRNKRKPILIHDVNLAHSRFALKATTEGNSCST
uniref:Uncharacterized protein n=1 Tax=Arundo donax TaxID=35708 RepID=A0A0A9BRX6_ARUDO